jgi:hypothetical protein
MKKKRKYKIGEIKPRCRFCQQRVSNYIQDQHQHMMQFHLTDLLEAGIPQEEIDLFKEGFKWELSTTNQLV